MKTIYGLGTIILAATSFYAGQVHQEYTDSVKINICIRPLYEQLVREEKKGINLNGTIEGIIRGKLNVQQCNYSYKNSKKAMDSLIHCLEN